MTMQLDDAIREVQQPRSRYQIERRRARGEM